MISPRRIGAMVVRGIELDVPHILTHPAPLDALAARSQQIVGGAGLLDRP